MFSWRDVLKIHPAADLFPLMSPDELKVLGEDIKANGMQVPIVLWRKQRDDEYQLLDGRNRLDAMEAVGINLVEEKRDDDYDRPPLYASELEWTVAHYVDPYAFVISANIHRRHLTAEQKRGLIAKVLKAQPTSSDRTVAAVTKADHKTVGAVRAEMESNGEIPHKDRTEISGRKARGRKPDPKPSPPPLLKSAKPASPAALSKPKPTAPKPIAPPLNSLSWSEATTEVRRKFIDAVGIVHIWNAATKEQQTRLINHINELQDAAEASRTRDAARGRNEDPSSLDERLKKSIDLIEGHIKPYIDEMRAFGQLQELCCHLHNLINDLEAEATEAALGARRHAQDGSRHTAGPAGGAACEIQGEGA